MAKFFSDPHRDDKLISKIAGQPNVVVASIEATIGLPQMSCSELDRLVKDFESIAEGAEFRDGHLRRPPPPKS